MGNYNNNILGLTIQKNYLYFERTWDKNFIQFWIHQEK